jgi:putative ABC transport system permease protein
MMIRNYIKIYFRSLLKSKLFTVINVAGLSIGITACLLVYNYVAFHRGFDKMYKAPENIYRVVTEAYVDGKLAETYGVTMQFLGPELKGFPEVQDFTRMLPMETMLVYKGDDIFDRLNIWAVDSTFIDFFGIKVLQSNGLNALKKPYSIVVTESIANKIFGTVDAVGKTIEIGYGPRFPYPLEITGVIEDSPVNSHLKYDVLISGVDPNSIAGQLTVFNGGDHTFYYPFFSTYVRMKENADPHALEAKLPEFLDHRIRTMMDKYGKRRVFLQPLGEVHLGPKYKWGAEMIVNRGTRANESSEASIRWISFSALTLLLFSIFNFVNLNLINYSKRSMELSVRKFLGAVPGDFLRQIFIEALILISIAAVISIGLLAYSRACITIT